MKKLYKILTALIAIAYCICLVSIIPYAYGEYTAAEGMQCIAVIMAVIGIGLLIVNSD